MNARMFRRGHPTFWACADGSVNTISRWNRKTKLVELTCSPEKFSNLLYWRGCEEI